jgi:Uncharacterized protein conserved in bacteria (DUF2252)
MLGWRLMGKTVVIREVLLQDLKLEMDQLTRDDSIGAARFLALVAGRAHASQMNAKARANGKPIWADTARKISTLLHGFGRALCSLSESTSWLTWSIASNTR